MLYRKLAVTAKIESVYGTDSAPTGVANAIVVRNPTFMNMEVDEEDRIIVRPYLGASETILVGSYFQVDFEVEIAGGGAAGTAPKYGPLLRACAASETTSAGVSVTYAPVSGAYESLTLHFNNDGVNFRMTGARGTVKRSYNSRKLPVFKFTFWGLYNAVADLVMPALTLTGWQLPLAVNKANTPALTLHGHSAIVESLEIDHGNQLVYRNLVNHESIQIVNRVSKGRISMEFVNVAAKDWFTIMRAGTTGTLTMTHGLAAGNICEESAPKVMLKKPDWKEMDGVTMLNADLIFLPSGINGNDDWSFVAR